MVERRQYSKITLYKTDPSGLFSLKSLEKKGMGDMDEKKCNEKTVKICTAKDLVELTLIRETLKEDGIDCLEMPYVCGAYDDIFVPAKGYADIYVLESDRQTALEVIASLEQEKKDAPKGEEEEDEEEE